MNHLPYRAVALVAAAATTFSACQASAAEGLTVHCAITAKPSYGKSTKSEEIYFVDFTAGKFCTADCTIIYNIASVTDQTLSLSQSSWDLDPEMISPSWSDGVTIDRKSGALTGKRTVSAASLSRTAMTGRCTFLPLLPVPVAVALRSAPKADRATDTGPAPQ